MDTGLWMSDLFWDMLEEVVGQSPSFKGPKKDSRLRL